MIKEGKMDDTNSVQNLTSLTTNTPGKLRFMIDFDANMCVLALQHTSAEDAIRMYMKSRGIHDPDNNESEKNELLGFLTKKRPHFYRLMKGYPLDRLSLLLRAAFQAQLLYLLTAKIPENNWLSQLNSYTANLPSFKRESFKFKIAEECLSEYSGAENALTPALLQELSLYKDALYQASEQLLEQLRQYLLSDQAVKARKANKQENEQKQDAAKTAYESSGRSTSFLSSEVREIRFILLLESCARQTDGTPTDDLAIIQRNWNSFFPDLMYCSQLEQQIQQLLHPEERLRRYGNVYFRAMGAALSSGGVERLQSVKFLQRIAVYRTVFVTLACSSVARLQEKTMRVCIEDTKEHLAQIGMQLPDNADSIIASVFRLFTWNGAFSEELLRQLHPYQEMCKKNFFEIRDLQAARTENDPIVTQLRLRIKELEDKISNIQYDTLRDLVLQLDRGSNGLRLGQLYRIAFGAEDRSATEIRELLQSFFHLLALQEITPIGGNQLNTVLKEDDDLYWAAVPADSREESRTRILVYPGWKVFDSPVAKPLYKAISD